MQRGIGEEMAGLAAAAQTVLADADEVRRCGAAPAAVLERCVRRLTDGIGEEGEDEGEDEDEDEDDDDDDATGLIALARDRIYAFRYSDVPRWWLRLYTDASVCAAVQRLRHGADAGAVVARLDMAVIMAGAAGPGRREVIDAVLAALEASSLPATPAMTRTRSGTTAMSAKPAMTRTRSGRTDERAVRRRLRPSMLEFGRTVRDAVPVVIAGAIDGWPALERWPSDGYLLWRTLEGRRLVPVEVGRAYTERGWGQRIMAFGEFLAARNDPGRCGLVYLAQHDLCAQIPALAADIAVPDYCYVDTMPGGYVPPAEGVQVNVWLGPGGTVSPLHCDPYHNVLAQVDGHKYVRLYAPDTAAALYPISSGGAVDMGNTSQVDVDSPDDAAFPLFRAAPYQETVLGPGECLFIPLGWWHFVKSLSTSASVSFWF